MTSLVVMKFSQLSLECCVLAEVGKNDKYVGHFPDLWFSGVNHSELVREEKEQRGQRKEKN